MKIYLAALYSQMDRMVEVAEQLQKWDYEIVSRWVWGETEDSTDPENAKMDLDDIEKADTIISFTQPRGSRTPGGGRHVEFGYGLARGKRLVLIGERENLFHNLPHVECYDNLLEFITKEKTDGTKDATRSYSTPGVQGACGSNLPVRGQSGP